MQQVLTSIVRIRGAPHKGLAPLISGTSLRMSPRILGPAPRYVLISSANRRDRRRVQYFASGPSA